MLYALLLTTATIMNEAFVVQSMAATYIYQTLKQAIWWLGLGGVTKEPRAQSLQLLRGACHGP